MLKTVCNRLIRERRGATAIEYAMIAGLIGLAIVGAATSIGQTLSSALLNVANGLH